MATAKAWDQLRAIETSPEYLELRAQEFPYRDIALAVVDLRGRLGLTQTQLAERVGTTQSVISRLESGRHPVEVKLLVRIADAFGLPIALHFGDAPAATQPDASLDPTSALSGDDLLDRFNAANTSRDWDQAHAAAAQLALEPTSARRRVALALDAYNQGKYAEAEEWASAAQGEPMPRASADVAALVRARSLINLDRPKDAVRVLERVAPGSPLGWVVSAARADAYVELHDAKRALLESEKALAEAMGEPEALYLAARTAWHADQIWEALRRIIEFRAAAPESLDGRLLHGSILGFLASRTDDEQGYMAALEVFRAAMANGDCEAMRLYSTTAGRLGDWSEAFRVGARFLKHRGDDGKGHCQHTDGGGDHHHFVFEHIIPDTFRALGEREPKEIDKICSTFFEGKSLYTRHVLYVSLTHQLCETHLLPIFDDWSCRISVGSSKIRFALDCFEKLRGGKKLIYK